MSSAGDKTKKCTSVWIHCNRCFENYVDQQRAMFILSCYDVVCEKCVIIVNQHDMKCLKCKNKVKGYLIGNNLKPNLKELFHPRPWTLRFEKMYSVTKFQTKQRNNFLIGCKKMKEFIASRAKERDRLKEQCKQLYFLHERKKKDKKKLIAVIKKLKEIHLSKNYAKRGLQKFRPLSSSTLNFDMPRINRQKDRRIPSTCHIMSKSRNDNTINFPNEDNGASTSFYL